MQWLKPPSPQLPLAMPGVSLLREVSPIHLRFVGRTVHPKRARNASGVLIESAPVTAHVLPTFRSLFQVGVDAVLAMDGLRRGEEISFPFFGYNSPPH